MARSSMALAGSLIAVLLLAIAPQHNNAQCTMSLLDVLSMTPALSGLATVVSAAGLNATLADKTLKVTVFAPNNTAINELVADLEAAGLSLADVTKARSNKAASILLYHVVPMPALSTSLMENQMLPTLLSGYNLTIDLGSGGEVEVEGAAMDSHATVVRADIKVCDSVVHVIDHVLLPAMLTAIPNYNASTGAPSTPMTPGAMSPPAGAACKVGSSFASGLVAAAATIFFALA